MRKGEGGSRRGEGERGGRWEGVDKLRGCVCGMVPRHVFEIPKIVSSLGQSVRFVVMGERSLTR